MSTNLLIQQLSQDLRRDEGVRSSAYTDSLGYWTIGVGRLIDRRKGGRLSDEEIDLLLSNDIHNCLLDIEREPWYLACETDSQRRALLNMRFQLGAYGIRTFKVFLDLMTQKKWAQAAEDLSHTAYAHQVPKRSARIQALINPQPSASSQSETEDPQGHS